MKFHTAISFLVCVTTSMANKNVTYLRQNDNESLLDSKLDIVSETLDKNVGFVHVDVGPVSDQQVKEDVIIDSDTSITNGLYRVMATEIGSNAPRYLNVFNDNKVFTSSQRFPPVWRVENKGDGYITLKTTSRARNGVLAAPRDTGAHGTDRNHVEVVIETTIYNDAFQLWKPEPKANGKYALKLQTKKFGDCWLDAGGQPHGKYNGYDYFYVHAQNKDPNTNLRQWEFLNAESLTDKSFSKDEFFPFENSTGNNID